MTLLDFGGGYRLRPAVPADHAAFNHVCLKTGDAGRDATSREDDPDLLGLIFAVPYQVLEPDFAFAVEGPDGVCGYLLGTPDSAGFYARYRRDWLSPLSRRISDPGPDPSRWRGSDWARRAIHAPEIVFPEKLRPFPAHGHIDLLAPARGRGVGRRALDFLMRRLTVAGAAGMHLQVHPGNLRAQGFYRSLGFERIEGVSLPEHTVFMARALADAEP